MVSLNQANSPARYRFQLYNPKAEETKTLIHEPLEWKEGTIEINRNLDVGGVFTNFTTDSLTFIKEGAEFLRDIWDNREVNGKCILIVSWFKFSTHSYVEMPSRFSLNFATAKPYVKIGNTSIGFEIEAVKEDILVKLDNRKSTNVDITKIKSVGGTDIIPYSVNLPKNVNFPAIDFKYQTIWSGYYPSGSNDIENNGSNVIYTEFNMKFAANEFNSEASEIDYQTYITNYAQVASFFEASEDREISFRYNVQIQVTNRKGGFFSPRNVYHLMLDVVNPDNSIDSSTELGECGRNTGGFDFIDTVDLNLTEGQKLKIYIKTDDVENVDAYIFYSFFKVTQVFVSYDARTREGFPIYEAIERVLQLILDSQYPFYSEFFGRTDTSRGYNTSWDQYVSENQLRFAHIFSGLHLRGASLFGSDNNSPLSISFKDLFDSINAIWNVGYETETRDNFERIRIENYDYFFEDVEAIDLSGRINRYDIETEIMPDLIYHKFLSGYEDYTYETINGRGEFNTENSRTSVLNTESEYNNKSKLRADTKGITDELIDELDTEDTEEDGDLFILKTQKDSDWTPEYEENITIKDNTSYFDDNTFNLYFTPSRNLRRHANRIKGAFSKHLSSKLIFQGSNKLQTLKTEGEGYTITENDDIEVKVLDAGLFKPIRHKVTCYFTLSDFETLMANKKGYITFSDSISGYLLNLKKKNNEDKAEIEIIEKI